MASAGVGPFEGYGIADRLRGLDAADAGASAFRASRPLPAAAEGREGQQELADGIDRCDTAPAHPVSRPVETLPVSFDSHQGGDAPAQRTVAAELGHRRCVRSWCWLAAIRLTA